MGTNRRRVLACCALVLLAGTACAQDVWTGVERVVAVGDVHSDYDQFFKVLRGAGLVDDRGNWNGGKAHLVQVGDALDRGLDTRRVLELLMKIEGQAVKAGGYVHALIGNHETMNLYGDWSYVAAEEIAGFAALETDEDREADAAAGRPEGYTERRRLFSPDGRYGKWIRGHNAIVRIDETVFLHGGISAKYAAMSLRQINDTVRAELRDSSRLKGGMIIDEDGPLWYRGYALGDRAALAPLADQVLANLEAKRIVVGHTPTDGRIVSRLSGKLLLIDVGLARAMSGQGRAAWLVIERGVVRAAEIRK